MWAVGRRGVWSTAPAGSPGGLGAAAATCLFLGLARWGVRSPPAGPLGRGGRPRARARTAARRGGGRAVGLGLRVVLGVPPPARGRGGSARTVSRSRQSGRHVGGGSAIAGDSARIIIIPAPSPAMSASGPAAARSIIPAPSSAPVAPRSSRAPPPYATRKPARASQAWSTWVWHDVVMLPSVRPTRECWRRSVALDLLCILPVVLHQLSKRQLTVIRRSPRGPRSPRSTRRRWHQADRALMDFTGGGRRWCRAG